MPAGPPGTAVGKAATRPVADAPNEKGSSSSDALGEPVVHNRDTTRVNAACMQCHERKLRCMMLEGGTCTGCQRRGLVCQKRVGKKRGRPYSTHPPYNSVHALHQHQPLGLAGPHLYGSMGGLMPGQCITMPGHTISVPGMVMHTPAIAVPGMAMPAPAIAGGQGIAMPRQAITVSMGQRMTMLAPSNAVMHGSLQVVPQV